MSIPIKNIALFPLNIFLLPGDFAQLYIFEERYKQLILDCKEQKDDFGIPFRHENNKAEFGSIVELTEISKRYMNGELEIVIKAKSIFKLHRFRKQMGLKPYPGGEVIVQDKLMNYQASERLVDRFNEHLIKSHNEGSDWFNVYNIGIFDIANSLKLNDVERLKLIQFPTTKDSEQYLLNYIKYLDALNDQQEKSIIDNIYLN